MEIEGIEKLKSRIEEASTIEDWSYILGDYISWGNRKISKNTAIFNMNAALDCPNRATKENGSSDTGYCQVSEDKCYAIKAERTYPEPLQYRRRQEYLWDCLDAETWTKAFLEVVDRKRNDVEAIRFSEAGDFRHTGDIIKVDRIAELLSCHGIDVYSYSASHKLDWTEQENFVLLQSNEKREYGDKRFKAVEEQEDIPESGIQCPYDYQKEHGSNDPIKCGSCKHCLLSDGPDIYITIH